MKERLVMPLRLNIGVSKKVGLPEFSSVGASCNLELELDAMLIHHDLDGLHEQIRGAFVAARQAVDDELARLRSQTAPLAVAHAAATNGIGPPDGSGFPDGASPRKSGSSPSGNGERNRRMKPATTAQVKAIHAIARAQHADLEGLLRDEYGVERPEDLSLADASAFIDQLKAASAV